MELEDWIAGVALTEELSVIGTNDGRVTATRADGTIAWTWTEPQGDVADMEALPDGRIVVASNRVVTLLDRDGKPVRTLGPKLPDGEGANTLAVSPDGKRIAVGCFDGKTLVIDVESGKTLDTTRADGWIEAVAFDPTGRTLAIAVDNGEVRIAAVDHLDKGTILHTTTRPSALVYGPDGTLYVGCDALLSFAPGLIDSVTDGEGPSALVEPGVGAWTLGAARDGRWVWTGLPADQVVDLIYEHDAIYAGVFENGQGHRVVVADPQTGQVRGDIEIGYGTLLDLDIDGTRILAGRTHGSTLIPRP